MMNMNIKTCLKGKR